MTTTADEKRDEAISSMENAIKYISEIVVDKCWGYDDYTKEYKSRLSKTMIELMRIKDELQT